MLALRQTVKRFGPIDATIIFSETVSRKIYCWLNFIFIVRSGY